MSAIVLIALPAHHATPTPAPTPTAAPPVLAGASAVSVAAQAPPPDLPPDLPADLPPVEGVLAGTFTAAVNAWDASAAALLMTHADALRRLRDTGLRIRSSGHCADRRRPRCTSLQAIRFGTLMRLIDLRRASGCALTVTGGTETGHSRGRYSHGTGFKVDIAHTRCVDRYIRRTFPYWKTRGDGARLYRPTSDPDIPVGPDVYADEPTHWDILFS